MIRDRDNGFRALQARLRDLQKGEGWTIKVGVPEGSGQHTGSKLSLAEVAAVHEFGTSTVPRRSFIGAWFDENGAALAKKSVADIAQFLKGTIQKGVVLARAGSRAVGGIQARIAKGIPPPLQPATIKRKGSSVPLIDTGQLRTAVTWAVKK